MVPDPLLSRMPLYPFQVEAAEWLAKLPRAGLFDQAGLGKTLSAIEGAKRAKVRKILILVPTVVLWNWHREIRTHAPDWALQVVSSSSDGLAAGWTSRLAAAPWPNVTVTTHGMLLNGGIRDRIVRQRWDLCIVDEAQMFRGPDSQRSNALYDLEDTEERATGCDWPPMVVSACDRVWLLSGTPMPNHAAELWTHFRGLWPERLPTLGDGKPISFFTFRGHFCHLRNTRYGVKPIGNKNLDQLKGMLAGISLRRKKSDVLKDLPPIRYEIVTLRPQKMPWEVTELNAKLRPHVLLALRDKLDGDSTPSDGFRHLKGMDDQEYSRLVHLTGLAKVEPVAELLTMELEADLGKVIVFGWHTDVLQAFAAKMTEFQPAFIDGSVSAAQRSVEVDRFQTDPKCRVFIGQIVAAGVGITLTAAADVVFLEGSAVPGDNSQAADRPHRIGQTKHVRVRFVALADTVDEELVQNLRQKTQMIREVFE